MNPMEGVSIMGITKRQLKIGELTVPAHVEYQEDLPEKLVFPNQLAEHTTNQVEELEHLQKTITEEARVPKTAMHQEQVVLPLETGILPLHTIGQKE